MGKFTFSTEDLNKGKVVENPQWAVVEITRSDTKDSAKGDSINYVLDFEVKSGEYIGMSIRVYFNEKWMILAKQLVEAITGLEVTPGFDVDFDAMVGKQVQGMLDISVPDPNNPKRRFSTISEFRPADTPLAE